MDNFPWMANERRDRERSERQSRRAHLTCPACQADTADIGAFDHGVPHTLDPQTCAMTARDVDKCGRTGNHFYHVCGLPVDPAGLDFDH